MPRPIKLNADYFPHDADMRNDPRIKALRRKFGIEGYGVYAMLLEFLTDADYFEFKNDALTLEIIAGDFDIETDKLTSILQYCFQLDLFQMDEKTSIISCKSLDKRLEPLLSKRKRDRNVVIDSDNTQSKVKESKVKKRKVKESKEESLRACDLPFVSEEFQNTWTEWELYRKQKKQKLTAVGARKQIKFLAKFTEREAIDILNQSMTNGWTGLFELKSNDKQKTVDVQDLKSRIKNL